SFTGDTNREPRNVTQQLQAPATKGSLGIDLTAAVNVTMTTTAVHKISTGIAGLAGLIVLPEVIDSDYTGEIMSAAYTLTPPLIIRKGTTIAQLVLYLKVATEKDVFTKATERLNRAFGSTGDALVNLVQQMRQRPMIQRLLQKNSEQQTLRALMNTGADVTIVSRHHWPQSWPLTPVTDSIQ
ncbi:Bifunctional protease/dUTPase, partial [Lamprotornis superbus]